MKGKKIIFHIGFWLLYGVLEFVANYFHYGAEQKWELIGQILVYMPGIMGATYFIAFVLVPRFLRQQKYTLFSIGLLFVMAVIYLLRYYMTIGVIYFFEHEIFPLPITKVLKNVIRDYAVIALAVCVQIIAEWQENLERVKQLIRAQTEAELAFLRNQLNPHFLFNTLNNLYSLARKKSDQTAESIMKLSQLLDFLIYDCRAAEIPLQKELDVIQDYMQLERLRYGEKLKVKWSDQIDQTTYPIAPLLLFTLVENTFKHGAVKDGTFKVDIKIKQQNDKLCFSVANSVSRSKDTINISSPKKGIGLENLKRRLMLLYPKQHELRTHKTGDQFLAELEFTI